ncbi:hypothetical protein ACFW81_04110 [Streptomyces angustmyceticus]|uniref:hypothetical protein n=1 Tax=Streptomyces angustmyceticus TaxID=285578 RepID=UPI0036A20DC9
MVDDVLRLEALAPGLAVAWLPGGHRIVALRLFLVGALAVTMCLLVGTVGLKIGHAVAAVLLGFYLRGTSLAPSISPFARS